MSYKEQYKVDLKTGQSGDWKVEKFTVSEEDSGFTAVRLFAAHGVGGFAFVDTADEGDGDEPDGGEE